MPLYEYKCNECGDVFELLVNRNGGDKTPKCTVCGGEDTERIPFSTFAVAVASSRSSGFPGECPHCEESEHCEDPKQCCAKN